MTKSKDEYTVNTPAETKGTEKELKDLLLIIFFLILAPLVCSLRLLLAVLTFLGFFLCYAQRNGIAYDSMILTLISFNYFLNLLFQRCTCLYGSSRCRYVHVEQQ